MSYMNQTEFAPAAGIQELSFDEIVGVDGGKISPGLAAGLRLAGRAALGAGLAGVAVGIAVEAVIWYNS